MGMRANQQQFAAEGPNLAAESEMWERLTGAIGKIMTAREQPAGHSDDVTRRGSATGMATIPALPAVRAARKDQLPAKTS